MTILTQDPTKYNLPYPSWYENQREMCERAVNLEPGRILVVEAPPGTGKSFLPATISHFRPGTTIVVATRDLQAQYQNTFPDFTIVSGQEHYLCALKQWISDFQDSYGESPTRADCSFAKPSQCPDFGSCPYEARKREALTARAKVLNYAYAYYTNWWRPHTNDLVCDEAHRVPLLLSNLISLEVAEGTRSWYNLPQFPFISGASPFAYKKIRQWLDSSLSSLSLLNFHDTRKMTRLKRFRLKLGELLKFLSAAEPGSWYVSSGQSLGKLMVRPVNPGRYAGRILDEHARTITFMSATIGEPELLLEELGLQGHAFEFLSLPHSFPPENRTVVWVKDSPKLSAKSGFQDYEHQANIIARILRAHKGQKGLVHTVSWSHTKRLAGLLSKRGLGDRLYIPEGERVQAIRKFKFSSNGKVALSPSWGEGLDFPDDEARFCIVAKIPFLSLGDPIIRLRLKGPGGNKWYRWQAALRVVQEAGRIVRHKEDWGVCYICDSQWPNVAKYAPKWFEVETV